MVKDLFGSFRLAFPTSFLFLLVVLTSNICETTSSCSKGTYLDRMSPIPCKICPKGFYQDVGINIKNCTACPSGYYVADDANDATEHEECKRCVNGTYYTNTETRCTVCNVGKRNVFDLGNTEEKHLKKKCVACPFGRYTDDAGLDSSLHLDCQQCEKGYYYVDRESKCRECEAGKNQYKDIKEDEEYCKKECQNYESACAERCERKCSGCPIGKHSDDATQPCTRCAKGMYQNENDSNNVACKFCMNGQYAPSQQSEACKKCAAGKYLYSQTQNIDEYDQETDCLDCPTGQYSMDGAPLCKYCEIGLFFVSPNEFCKECIPGRYADSRSGATAEQCLGCIAGRYQDESKKPFCMYCSPGQYQNSANATICEKCPIGFYNGDRGEEICKKCPVGFQQNYEGKSHCDNCLPGQFGRPLVNADIFHCVECDRGKYSKISKQVQCLPCSKGLFQSERGQNKCNACIPGMFAPSGGQINCNECPLGFVSNYNSQKCDLCQIGKTTFHMGSVKCLDCPIGQIGTSSGSCVECDNSKFQSKIGQTDCLNCPIGFTPLSSENNGVVSRTGCVNPAYFLPNDCSHQGEYLNDCAERDNNCTYHANEESNHILRLNRTCLQCEPGMICDIESMLSKRNILRRFGWYYLDSNFVVKMDEDPKISLKRREADDHRYFEKPRKDFSVNQWVERNNYRDEAYRKLLYDPQLFSSVECPIKHRCCGVLVITKSGTMPVESEHCARMNYSGIYGFKDSQSRNTKYKQIRYPYWSITCADGVDNKYPLCAKCLTGYEAAGADQHCTKCSENATFVRVIILCILLFLLLVVTLIVKKNAKCVKLCRLHAMKRARGDIFRMIRLLIDFFQIVVSMEQVMPSIPWPKNFISHLRALNYADFNIMEILGVQCSYNVDYINSLAMYFAVPWLLVAAALIDLVYKHFQLKIRMTKAKNTGKLDKLWNSAVSEMFEFLLEPNKLALVDHSAPEQVVTERGIHGLLKLSSRDSRSWSDPHNEAKKMMKRFATNSKYLSKSEFCRAFTQVLEDRSNGSSKKGNTFAKDAVQQQKYNLVLWATWQKTRSTILEYTFLLLLIAHAPVSKAAMRLFRCKKVGDRSYLMADFGVNCGTVTTPESRYDLAEGFTIAMVALYTVMFPLLLAGFLFYNRTILFSFRVKMIAGWVYLHYKPQFYWWTIYEIFLKVFLMGFLFFFDDSIRPVTATAVSVVSLGMIAVCRPYKSNIVSGLSIVKWGATALMYLSSTQIKMDDSNTEGFMIFLVIVVDACFILGVVLITHRLINALKAGKEPSALIKVHQAMKKIITIEKLERLSQPPAPMAENADDVAAKIVKKSLTMVIPQEREDNKSINSKPKEFVPPAPRHIGSGWWETYDPSSGNFFYSNIDGKPTSWRWPSEVPVETPATKRRQWSALDKKNEISL